MQNFNVFMCQGRILLETRSYIIYMKPETFCFVNNMMSPYDLQVYEILSGFSFLKANLSTLLILHVCSLLVCKNIPMIMHDGLSTMTAGAPI